MNNMEITNEIKAKIFAQYLGQKLERGGMMTIELLYACKNAAAKDFDDIFLKLKPISSITDEDLIAVAKFVFSPESLHTVEVGRQIIDDNEAAEGLNWFMIYQYLTNAGYDLPHYLLGEKTLKESGLAVY